MTTPQELWNSAVHDYLDVDDSESFDILFPAFNRAMGDLAGKVVLDYGCGNGKYARMLAAMGAGQVIGADRSHNMIATAIAIDPTSNIQYYEVPDNTLAPLSDCSVDIVVANMVFMMAPTKSDLAQSFAEIHRVLRPGGTFMYSIIHPAFTDKESHDCRNVFEGDGFHYLNEEDRFRFILKGRQGGYIDGGFFDYHYTLTTYLQTVIDTGFALRSFEEMRYPDEFVKKHDIPEEIQRYPHSIVVVWRKGG